jgi:leucine efflux protein
VSHGTDTTRHIRWWTASAGMRMRLVWGITDLWTYVLGAAAIILLPGPNSLFVLSVAARRGVRTGYRAACGVFLGDTVLMVLSAAGVASLLKAYPPLFMVIKYVGAGYLAYVGVGILIGALRRWRGGKPVETPDVSASAVDEPASLRHPFRRAAVISLLNPKAILFFISFFIQFVQPGYAHPALSFLVLGAIVQVFSALYLSALIFGGRYLAGQFHRRRRVGAAVTASVGALFLAFGLKLATASIG